MKRDTTRQHRPGGTGFLPRLGMKFFLILCVLCGPALAMPAEQAPSEPLLKHLEPDRGLPGETIKLTGQNFTREARVIFRGVSEEQPVVASPFEVTADGVNLSVVVPAKARTGPVFVEVAGRRSATGLLFSLKGEFAWVWIAVLWTIFGGLAYIGSSVLMTWNERDQIVQKHQGEMEQLHKQAIAEYEAKRKAAGRVLDENEIETIEKLYDKVAACRHSAQRNLDFREVRAELSWGKRLLRAFLTIPIALGVVQTSRAVGFLADVPDTPGKVAAVCFLVGLFPSVFIEALSGLATRLTRPPTPAAAPAAPAATVTPTPSPVGGVRVQKATLRDGKLTIKGSGFSTDMAKNAVRVNNRPAVVTKAAADEVGAVVPDGITADSHARVTLKVDGGAESTPVEIESA